MRIIDHLIAGHAGGAGARESDVFDPNTGQVQAQVRLGGQAELDAAVAANLRLLQDVDVKLTVEIGSTTLSLRELLALGESSIIELDRQAGDLLDVFVNGTLIGRGEVVTVGERFGVKMTELVAPEKRG